MIVEMFPILLGMFFRFKLCSGNRTRTTQPHLGNESATVTPNRIQRGIVVNKD
jgi:hypothetical protein